jgi:hypothetical protein
MLVKRRLAPHPAVIAALAVGAPVGSARAATVPARIGPSCPDRYDGPTNVATSWPYWMTSNTMEYPRQRS